MEYSGYLYEHNGFTLRILPYSDTIIRVTYGEKKRFPCSSLIITAREPQEQIGTRYKADGYDTIQTNYLTLTVNLETLSITYQRADKTPLSTESDRLPRVLEAYDIYHTTGGTAAERLTADGIKASITGGKREFVRSAYHAKLSLEFSETEAVFGLGSHEEGYSDIRGKFIPLYQENMRIALPYFVSSAGYAYLFDCTSFMTFDDRDGQGTMYLDSVDAMDYYFIAGTGFDDICYHYRYLTGVTPMLPKWAIGYIQSKERYTCAEELLQTVKEYRRREVPLDLIVQDWQYWKEGAWGDKLFDSSRYPDLPELTESLHNMGAHLMVSIWPNMSSISENRREFEVMGKLLNDESTYNAFDKEARAIYWNQANNGIFRHGTDAWWCDSSEPFDAVWHGAERPELPVRMKLSINEFKKNLDDGIINTYSLVHSMGIYEGQRSTQSHKRVLNLTRSGYAGQHRYGTVVWSGDISASWETLRRQVHIAQNYIACGEAYWNSDIGGFFVKKRDEWFWRGEYQDGCKDENYRELYVRWLQFAVFTPMLRSHGTDTPREIWNFGERGDTFYDAIEAAIRLRYSLLPYFYSINAAVTFEGSMPITPLALAFPEDGIARHTTNEYMYGHEFLVCPVTTSMADKAQTAEIYLPPGGWYNFYTEEYHSGGCYISTEISLMHIPLFVRAGSIVPTTEVMQYVDEKPDAPYEIVIYGGADGKFALYDDDGDGYDYEHGRYARTFLRYNASDGTVREHTIGCMEYKHQMTYRIISPENCNRL